MTIIARFETPDGLARWGVLAGNNLEEILPDPYGPWAPTGMRWPLKDVRLLAPVQPGKIIAIGLNYRDHAAEFGHPLPLDPLISFKPPSTVIGTGDEIRRPAGSSRHRIDHEGELAVIIGRKAWNVPASRAMSHVLGLTIMNDVTDRDLQKKDRQWGRAKGFDTFAPLGPWIAVGLSPKNLRIQTFVNGSIRQDSRTSRMVFGVPELVSHVSRVMTLNPGDVISTGTPAGIGPIKKGDTVEVRIEKIGSLVNKVR